MNIGHDDEEELSSVLWRVHFTTERVVSGVVSGVYEIPQDVLVNLNDSTDATYSTPTQPRRGRRRVISCERKPKSILHRSATFQQLVLQAHVLRDKMSELGEYKSVNFVSVVTIFYL